MSSLKKKKTNFGMGTKANRAAGSHSEIQVLKRPKIDWLHWDHLFYSFFLTEVLQKGE